MIDNNFEWFFKLLKLSNLYINVDTKNIIKKTLSKNDIINKNDNLFNIEEFNKE